MTFFLDLVRKELARLKKLTPAEFAAEQALKKEAIDHHFTVAELEELDRAKAVIDFRIEAECPGIWSKPEAIGEAEKDLRYGPDFEVLVLVELRLLRAELAKLTEKYCVTLA
jgi:hypothetical protein